MSCIILALVDSTKCLHRFDMSSDNASSTVTYTSVSSDSNEPSSWGIPLVNAGELPDMDPYEEVAQQGQAHPLLPAYVPDPMELDEYVPLPRYIADSDPIEDDTDADSIDYSDEPEDGEERNDEDDKPTKDEEEEEHLAPTDSYVVHVVDPIPSAGDTEAFETDEFPSMSASMEVRIAEHAATPIPPTSLAYDQAPLGHRAAMIRIRDDIPEEDMPPRRRFILAAPHWVLIFWISSPSLDDRTIARAADRAEDVGYVRALHASEHRMMTSIEEVNLRVSYQAQVRRKESEDFYTQLHDARTDRRDIRLEIDVVRGQRTAYETELHEVRQAYLSSEARNRALLARLETLETHMSRMEWQRQRAEDDSVRQMMRTHVLEARAQIDTVEDTGSSC
ncbi:hypothetical protein Tco_0364126 [Tanacetum coccineum]